MEFPRQEYWSGLPFPSPWINLFFRFCCHTITESSFSFLGDCIGFITSVPILVLSFSKLFFSLLTRNTFSTKLMFISQLGWISSLFELLNILYVSCNIAIISSLLSPLVIVDKYLFTFTMCWVIFFCWWFSGENLEYFHWGVYVLVERTQIKASQHRILSRNKCSK